MLAADGKCQGDRDPRHLWAANPGHAAISDPEEDRRRERVKGDDLLGLIILARVCVCVRTNIYNYTNQ